MNAPRERTLAYSCPNCGQAVYAVTGGELYDASTSYPHVCGPWCSAWMTCAICNREWVAVYPACAPALECPGCGFMNTLPDEGNNGR